MSESTNESLIDPRYVIEVRKNVVLIVDTETETTVKTFTGPNRLAYAVSFNQEANERIEAAVAEPTVRITERLKVVPAVSPVAPHLAAAPRVTTGRYNSPPASAFGGLRRSLAELTLLAAEKRVRGEALLAEVIQCAELAAELIAEGEAQLNRAVTLRRQLEESLATTANGTGSTLRDERPPLVPVSTPEASGASGTDEAVLRDRRATGCQYGNGSCLCPAWPWSYEWCKARPRSAPGPY